MKKASKKKSVRKARHAEPTKASLKEIPEVDFTKARMRRNPYAARIAREGITVQVGKGRPRRLEEVGGTSVLMIGAVAPSRLGLPSPLGSEPLPVLTWRALSHVPDVATLGSVLLGGVWWITHRREEVALAEGRKPDGRPAIGKGGAR